MARYFGRRRRSRGQSMVEFALIAPLMFILLLGLIDLARAVYYYNVISNSAREGAREAILAYNQCQNTAPCSSPPGGSSVVGVRPAMVRAGGGIVAFPTISDTGAASGTAPSCTPSANNSCVWVFVVGSALQSPCTAPGPNDGYSSCDFNRSKSGGQDVVVEVEYNFVPFTPLMKDILGNSSILWAKSQMRTEY